MSNWICVVFGISLSSDEFEKVEEFIDREYLSFTRDIEGEYGILADGNTGDFLIGFIYLCDNKRDVYDLSLIEEHEKSKTKEYLLKLGFEKTIKPSLLLRIMQD